MKTMQEMAAFKTDEKSDMQEQNTVNCNNSLQCKNIENTLTLQNERLELIIKKLEEDTRKANENRKEAMNALQSAYDGQKMKLQVLNYWQKLKDFNVKTKN